MSLYRRLFLTFDAFGTLFFPREPVSKQYAELARKHGLSGFTDDEIGSRFVEAFRHARHRHPNYGKDTDMGASKWWSNVVQSTFLPFTSSNGLPGRLVPDLLHRFSTSDGYELYPDVLPILETFRSINENGREVPDSPRIVVGVTTNSDDRVPSILSSLGLRVGSLRHAPGVEVQDLAFEYDEDISFVVLSYDVGFEKPDRRIFDAAMRFGGTVRNENDYFIHVGDELTKDAHAAEDAGWDSIWLDRCNERTKEDEKAVLIIDNLLDLVHHLSPNSASVAKHSRELLRLGHQ